MIRVDIVHEVDFKDVVVESKEFPNVDSIFNVEVSNWVYDKLIEYDKKYHFNDWESLSIEDSYDFVYYNNDKFLTSSSMIEDYMNL